LRDDRLLRTLGSVTNGGRTLDALLQTARKDFGVTSWVALAHRLGVSWRTLYRWRAENALPANEAERMVELTGRTEFRDFITQPVADRLRELEEEREVTLERVERLEAAVSRIEARLTELAEAQEL
jgi:hypothetical protein